MSATKMVTLLITALAILIIIGIGVYFWEKSATEDAEYILPPKPEARSLFADDPSMIAAETERVANQAQQQADSLIAKAKGGERSALAEAHQASDKNLYDQVLTELTLSADSDAKLLGLMSYVSQNELPVNDNLARAVIESWQQTPDRNRTAKALHFAALSDDAEIYATAVERALELWREEKLRGVSAAELQALFDGEFWVLSSRSRSSGAGFVLKRTLASARRELEAATSANQ